MPRSLPYVISITQFVYINVSVILHVCYNKLFHPRITSCLLLTGCPVVSVQLLSDTELKQQVTTFARTAAGTCLAISHSLTYKIYYRGVVLQIDNNEVTIMLMLCVSYVTEISYLNVTIVTVMLRRYDVNVTGMLHTLIAHLND